MKVFIEDFRTGETLKRCSKCGRYRKFGDYRHQASAPHGVSSRCKSCLKRKPIHKNREDRFWKYYHSHTQPNGECLEWTGQCRDAAKKQPTCRFNNKRFPVRRLIYQLVHGSMDDDVIVTTYCRNPRCVRQSHLIAMAKDDFKAEHYNNRMAVGTQTGAYTHPEQKPKGATHGMAKLTDDAVRQIRDMYAQKRGTQRSLAQHFGVSQRTILFVVKREHWAHVQ